MARRSLHLVALALIGMSACGGESAQNDSTVTSGAHGQDGSVPGDGGAAAALGACSWPASLDAADAAFGSCVAARAALVCHASNGDGELCVSNDPTQCPGPSLVVGAVFSACTDQCHADEYAVACGGPGPGPWADPPAGCREAGVTPGGVSFSCCPCGGAGSADAALVWTDDDGGTFACGSSAVCDGHLEVCQHVQGGVPPGVDLYACAPVPAECIGDVSCGCVTTALRGRGAGQCAAEGSDITVQIEAP